MYIFLRLVRMLIIRPLMALTKQQTQGDGLLGSESLAQAVIKREIAGRCSATFVMTEAGKRADGSADVFFELPRSWPPALRITAGVPRAPDCWELGEPKFDRFYNLAGPRELAYGMLDAVAVSSLSELMRFCHQTSRETKLIIRDSTFKLTVPFNKSQTLSTGTMFQLIAAFVGALPGDNVRLADVLAARVLDGAGGDERALFASTHAFLTLAEPAERDALLSRSASLGAPAHLAMATAGVITGDEQRAILLDALSRPAPPKWSRAPVIAALAREHLWSAVFEGRLDAPVVDELFEAAGETLQPEHYGPVIARACESGFKHRASFYKYMRRCHVDALIGGFDVLGRASSSRERGALLDALEPSLGRGQLPVIDAWLTEPSMSQSHTRLSALRSRLG